MSSYLQDTRKSEQEKALIDDVKSAVLRRMKEVGIDITDSIVGQSVRSNYDWSEQFNTFRGSAFGLTHELGQLAMFRPTIKHPK